MPRQLVAASLLLLVAAGVWEKGIAQVARPIVYVIPIEGMIDLGLAPFLSRTIREAEEAGAAAVLLDINTFGGRVDAAVAMRDALLNAPVRTIAFVNQRAISAGALIALACETHVMAEGGTIGAAAPVVGGGPAQPQPADEKSVSYVRKEFRATAERAESAAASSPKRWWTPTWRSPGVVDKGKLLTLTTSEALEHKVADLTADTLDAALEAAGLARRRRPARIADLGRDPRSVSDQSHRQLAADDGRPAGAAGRDPDAGVRACRAPSACCRSALFFWGHWIVQLAGWEELLLVSLGVLLLGSKLFVIPGFGVAGIAGIVALVAGLGMTLVGAGATVSVIIGALGRVAISILLAMAGALALLRVLPQLPFGRRLVLETDMQADLGYASAPESDRQWLGRTGTALSPLRPAGIAEIDGARVDVVSDGGFIEAGAAIEVTRVDGNRIVVRRAPSRDSGTENS